jgi:hypothetical protein
MAGDYYGDTIVNTMLDGMALAIHGTTFHPPCGLYGCQICWPLGQTAPTRTWFDPNTTFTIYVAQQDPKSLIKQIREFRDRIDGRLFKEYREAKEELKSLIEELQQLLKEEEEG